MEARIIISKLLKLKQHCDDGNKQYLNCSIWQPVDTWAIEKLKCS